MVNSDGHANLQSLAEEYSIHRRFQSDPWPQEHTTTFQAIRHLHGINYESYAGEVCRESSKLWKQHNLRIADHLTEKSSELNEQRANESTWRMGLENSILRRFSIEVACPRCKHRLWRSEIEYRQLSSGCDGKAVNKRERKDCTCAVGDRPIDQFDFEASRVFGNRTEETFMIDAKIIGLPRQRPDRTFGLQETDNIRQLLDQPLRVPIDAQDGVRLRDLLRTTPFKQRAKLLHFPFLVIEAKSASAQDSFTDMQVQTALPIKSLLDLQSGLWEHATVGASRLDPLVWFLGYKGSDWKLYACYIRSGAECTATYNIHYLQGGDMMTRDGALQLVLMLDYIFDWARDCYRLAVLKQLNALANGGQFRETDQGLDSNIESRVQDRLSQAAHQMHAPTMTFPHDGPSLRSEPFEVDLLPRPSSQFGLVQSMTNALFECIGLRITLSNIDSFLNSYGVEAASATGARDLLRQFNPWHDILVMNAAGLDDLEHTWTGDDRFKDRFDEEIEFCVVLQYRCYVDLSWTVTRELSYLAISTAALRVLVTHASIHHVVPRFQSLQGRMRRCPNHILQSTMNCLRSGSPWQLLCSALASTLFHVHPGPARIPDGHAPSVTCLVLGYIRAVKFSAFIHKAMQAALTVKSNSGELSYSRRGAAMEFTDHRGDDANDIWRLSKRLTRIENVPHDEFKCCRCIASGQNHFELRNWDQQDLPSQSPCNAVLVASLREEDIAHDYQSRHGLCLFVFQERSGLSEDMQYSAVVDALGHEERIYHTIRHGAPLSDLGTNALLWNLPWPYRPSTRAQRSEIERWVYELEGNRYPLAGEVNKVSMHLWVTEQILLYYLNQGKTYKAAANAVKAFREQARAQYRRRHGLPTTERNLPLSCVQLSSFWARVYVYSIQSEQSSWEQIYLKV